MKLPPQVTAVVRQGTELLPLPASGIDPLKIQNLEAYPDRDWVEEKTGRAQYFHCKTGYHWSHCPHPTNPYHECCPPGQDCKLVAGKFKCSA